MNKKIILLLVVVVIGVAIGGYFLFFAQKQSGTSLSSSPSEKLKDILGIQPSTKNWQTYANSGAGLSIKYPEGYTVKDEFHSSRSSRINFAGVISAPRARR